MHDQDSCHVFHRHGLDIDVYKAWNLVKMILPQYVCVSKFSGCLHLMTWTVEEESVSPWEAALEEPHYSKVLEADFSYPIIIGTYDDGEEFVVDGAHRVMKAYLLDEPMIMGIKIPWDILAHECPFNEEDYKRENK